MFDESKYIMATQNQAQNMALDLMLKTLIASSQFNEQSEKNWTTISRAVPGTTPREVNHYDLCWNPQRSIFDHEICMVACPFMAESLSLGS